MRSTIIKRFAVFIGVLGVVAVAIVFIQQFQVGRLARSVAERADAAVQQGDFDAAAKLYAEHLMVVPDDAEIQIKYADALLKQDPSPQKQAAAAKTYFEVLRRFPGREDVRRKQMELKFAMGQFIDTGAEADLQMLLSLPQNKTDGNLLFMMGRCREEGKNDLDAKHWYEEAIKHDGPRKIEAYQRLAALLREPSRLNDPQAADQVVDEMVRSSPDDYRVYLARGRYRRQYRLPGARGDIEKALKLTGDKPEILLEMARAAATESGQQEARKILEAGLAKTPASTELHEALADLELRAGHLDTAIETLERGLKVAPNKTELRATLANYLAMRGDTSKLLLQIEELKKIGCNPRLLEFLKGYYCVNAAQFREARHVLAPLESLPGWPPHVKSRISTLLARCYGQLGEPELQQEAYIRALSASPQDAAARIGLIDQMVKRGDIEEAIKGYRALVDRMPGVGIPLARLLIARNERLPARQRDWGEVKKLIDDAEKSAPESVEPVILRAGSAVVQGRIAEARDELEKGQARFPKSVSIWCARANLLQMEKQFDAASRLLEQGKKELGDHVELRLQFARLAVARGGPQVAATLNELAEGIDSFSKADRHKLLTGLARDFARVPDPKGARRMWSVLAEQEPGDVDVRLNLLDVAFELGDRGEIERIIKQLEQIEGNEGSLASVCRARYLIWQAGQSFEKDPADSLRLRTKARVLLNELASRRADLPAVPVALAQLEQQELRQGGLTAAEIAAKEESMISQYRRAIDLGQRNPAIVRETVRLLFKHKRGSEALDVVNSIPVDSQFAGALGRQAISYAVGNRDLERAEELARKAVAARPADFQERIWLVQILLNSGRQAEAEKVIREALDLSRSDPDRWIVLVKFLVMTRQPAAAAKAIDDAGASLSPLQAPLALGQCCALLGRFYEGSDEAAKAQWYGQAKGWYAKAQAAHPDDLSVMRRVAEFFIQTRQTAEVEAQLAGILKGGSKVHGAPTVAWARRTLALTLVSSPDPERARRALSLLEPAGPTRTVAEGGARVPEDPEDSRTLARVLEAQGNPRDRQRAIEILESLVSKSQANTVDRLLLAQLQEATGHWPKALVIYRDLNAVTRNARDLETLGRRPMYLSQFARSLLRNHKTGDEQDLNEVQDLVDELAKHQPGGLETLVLQVELYRARNQVDKAVELIQESVQRPKVTPAALKTLATIVEKLNRDDVAEQLYRQYAALPNNGDGPLALALYLGRRGRVDEALDQLAPLWAQRPDTDPVAVASFEVVSSSSRPATPSQISRIADWFEQAIKQKKDSVIVVFNLASVRSEQMRYDEAMALYESVIKRAPGSALAPPVINRLLALSYNNVAWLTALRGDRARDALADVNHAIELMGPQADLLDTRGIVHLGLKQTKDAINDLEIAVKKAPSPNKLFHLAQAYFQANDKEKARQYLKEARARGLDERSRTGQSTLHSLEQPAYQKLLDELGLS